MKPGSFRLALIQMGMSAVREENFLKAEQMLREAAAAGAQVACLPELFLSPYFCQSEKHDCFDLAEPVPGPATERLGKLARELQLVVVASLFEKRAAGMYHNTTATLNSDGRMAGKYRKMHIPDDPGFYEKFYFTPGDLGYQGVETSAGRLGVLICWDQWYPEAARLTAMQDVSLLLYPTAIGWIPPEKPEVKAEQHDAWRTVQRGHAIANGVYVAACNRVGFEACHTSAGGGLEFWGRSFICDPYGKMLAEASTDGEEILYADISLARQEHVRRFWPFWRDRRVETFAGITEKFGNR